MIPTKKALSVMNRPAKPMKQVTTAMALETGLRNATTAIAPIRVNAVKIQKTRFGSRVGKVLKG